MEGFNIKKIGHSGKDFNKYVCSFLGRKDIYKEIGYPIFAEPNKIFLVALLKNKPVGVAGIVEKKE